MKETDDEATERAVWKELGISRKDWVTVDEEPLSINQNKLSNSILMIGFGTAVVVNLGFLLSLPPVLRGRGM
jgi:hypothetical protein